MIDVVLLSFAFAAGVAAFFNPCGYAVLIAYISHFFSTKEKKTGVKRNLLHGLSIGIIATIGFLTVFALTGLGIAFVSRSIAELIPWINFFLGFLLIGIGFYLLAGRTVSLNTHVGKINPNQTSALSFYKYGIIYAAASLGCVLPIFISVVVSGLASGSLTGGLGVFLAYSVGMGIVMTIVSIALATSKNALVNKIKKFAPHINKINAVILIALGIYLVQRQVLVGGIFG